MDQTQQETGRVYIYIWLQKQVSRGGDGKKDLCAGMFGFGVGGRRDNPGSANEAVAVLMN